MKIVIRSRTCRLTFEKNDPYFAEKTLVLEGEGIDNTTFCVHKHLDMFWSTPSPENPNQLIGTTIKASERDAILSYAVQKANENGYTLTLW